MYTLHSKGIASCPLNANMTLKNTYTLKKLLDIPSNENIVMFIAVGNYKDTNIIPVSKRKNVSEIYRVISE
jgi:hypothetical protein